MKTPPVIAIDARPAVHEMQGAQRVEPRQESGEGDDDEDGQPDEPEHRGQRADCAAQPRAEIERHINHVAPRQHLADSEAAEELLIADPAPALDRLAVHPGDESAAKAGESYP